MKIAIIGSGLSSTSAAKALIKRGIKPILLDIGQNLDSKSQNIVDRMSRLEPEEWDEKDRKYIIKNPTVNPPYKSPKKLYFGSDYFYGKSFKELPFKSDEHPPMFTHARGGLSVGWGASILPPADSDLATWPIKNKILHPHFKRVLEDLPYSAVNDELNSDFPIFINSNNGIKLSAGNKTILDDFKRSKIIEDNSITFGQSRLLVQKNDSSSRTGCKMCGHCMSGCVYGSIYKSDQDIKKLSSNGLIDYRDQSIVKSFTEKDGKVEIYYLNKNRDINVIYVDKVLVGAGAVNTARLVLESKKWFNKVLKLKSTVGMIIPLIRLKKLPYEWPNTNTMPQIFLEFKVPEISDHWVHSQIGTPNELVYRKLNIDSKQSNFYKNIKRYFSRHLITSLCNMHSDHANGFLLTLNRSKNNNSNLLTSVSENDEQVLLNIKKALSRFTSITKKAGYYVLTPMVSYSYKGNGGHVGGTFPMKKKPQKEFETDTLGRLSGWENIHIIDSSIFPSLPGTTIGLLAMANARRIASEIELKI